MRPPPKVAPLWSDLYGFSRESSSAQSERNIRSFQRPSTAPACTCATPRRTPATLEASKSATRKQAAAVAVARRAKKEQLEVERKALSTRRAVQGREAARAAARQIALKMAAKASNTKDFVEQKAVDMSEGAFLRVMLKEKVLAWATAKAREEAVAKAAAAKAAAEAGPKTEGVGNGSATTMRGSVTLARDPRGCIRYDRV